MISAHPSGDQFEIRHGNQKATIVEVGGGIRAYEVDGRAVLDPFPVDRICDGAHGAPLIPWPNRLDGGRYSFDGADYQLPLTEPEKDNAIHGFLRWVAWTAESHGPDAVTMSTSIAPRPGFPFGLEVTVSYRLDEGGLSVKTEIANVGESPCPVGHGQHPYLSPGEGLIDECQLQHPGTVRILTDERQLPAGREDVAGTAFDCHESRQLGFLDIDFAFTDLIRDQEGKAWTRLTGTDGKTASIWIDESYPLLQLYTGHTLAPDRARRGLGTEPMSCAPNAFNNGEGLIRLGPGEMTSAAWGVELTD
ncbi:MAG: aldose 1-epimerase family protein [Solirubrobacterales bacterium]|nr:aldose 1-epimerase family protein [Solirubrobacterales bacterium]